jgi:predicted component of type VI protein secretion system
VKLVVLEGPAARDSFEIAESPTLIGRAPDCQVLVFDPQASRHHAQLVQVGGEYVVESLQEANPTIVNDRVLAGRRRLADGDLIVVGGVLFEVDIPPITRPASGLPGEPAPAVQERRTPRPPAWPPEPPRELLRQVAARLGTAAQRIQARASPATHRLNVSPTDLPIVEAIVADHERLGGDVELARLAGLLSERLSNQTDMRALYRLGAEAAALLAWSQIARRSIDHAIHLAEVLGAR